MKFRAVVKRSEGWWIGWLVGLPGVNAQERTREELIESLKIGAEDMLMAPVEPKEPGEELVTIEFRLSRERGQERRTAGWHVKGL